MKKLVVYLLAVSAMLLGLQLGVWLVSPSSITIDPASQRVVEQGRVVGYADQQNTHAWLGLPYAKAPVDNLRWRAPLPAESWEGVLEATDYPSYCMQVGNPSVTFNIMEWDKASGSEDCLYLNIWSPAFASNKVPVDNQRLPVMVWIHGGGNTIGYGGSYDGAMLAGSQEVIVVTLNYRLGILGWFSHSALRDTSNSALDASGNYGTLDIIQALHWVRDNIAAFGGDPERVTVFGESAGGRNVITLLASPKAAGLFQRAIVQSGGINSMALSRAENFTDDKVPGDNASSNEILLHLLQADNKAVDRAAAKRVLASLSDQEVSDYLREKSLDELLSFYTVVDFGMYSTPQIFEDGAVLPAMPMLDIFLNAENYNVVPTITGSNRDEAKMFLMNDKRMVKTSLGLFKSIIDQKRYELHNRYRSDTWQAMAVDVLAQRLLDSQTASGEAAVWTYRFDWDEGGNTLLADYSQVLGAAHSLDIPFVFGQYTGLTMPGVFVNANKTSRELLSAQMMSYWAAFAYEGNPARGRSNDLPEWPVRTADNKQSLLLDSESDGGLQISSPVIDIDELKQRLASDDRFKQPQDRCELYVKMFKGSLFFNLQEYRSLADCETVSENSFSRW